MNSFYMEGAGAVGAQARLLREEARHAAQVLRLKPGESIYAVDEDGRRFEAELVEVSREGCACRLLAEAPDNEPEVRITLYQGLPKGDKLDFIVQKLTELGIRRICPVKMDRCVVKLDEKDGKKRRERLEKIAREAAKQCKRGCAPEIALPAAWRELRQEMAGHEMLLVPWEEASGLGMKKIHSGREEARDIGIVIGPEGGMSEKEVLALKEMGAMPLRLGPRILRTETAAVAACAMAMLLWGDLG